MLTLADIRDGKKQARPLSPAEKRKLKYAEYLLSDAWNNLRMKVMHRAGGICEGCLEAPATQVHHKTYQHIFNEFAFELVALCRPCHERVHAGKTSYL